MQFVPQEGGTWLLIDETAPADANVIAVLNGPVEVLALKGLCEARLTPGQLGPFEVSLEGRSYRVTPHADRGARITLRIDGSSGLIGRVETEFSWPGRVE